MAIAHELPMVSAFKWQQLALGELQLVHWRFAAPPFFSQQLERSACVAIYIYIHITNSLNVRLHCVAMQTAARPNPNLYTRSDFFKDVRHAVCQTWESWQRKCLAHASSA